MVCFRLTVRAGQIYNSHCFCVDTQMLPPGWIRLYRSEFEKAVRHVRMSSRFITFGVYLAIVATVTSSIANQKLLFHCYFPFETRYAYSLQG